MKRHIFLVCLYFLFSWHTCWNAHFSLDSVKKIHIKSLRQSCISKQKILFDGYVEVNIDGNLHLWADHVIFDKGMKNLYAWADETGAVICEDNHDRVIMADRIRINYGKKTGDADAITIRVARGYVSAAKAERRNDAIWVMNDVMYTPCDKKIPHWSFNAKHAEIYPNGLLKTKNISFALAAHPIMWLPWLTIPAQGQSRTGFLMPKFSYDYEAGIGMKQSLYIYFCPRLDTTLSFDWRDRKGVIFSDECRWACGPNDMAMINVDFAWMKNVFEQKGNQIVQSSAKRYWVHGSITHVFSDFKPWEISSLARMDFGTDKRITYIFSNNTDDIDDLFSNSYVLRCSKSEQSYEARINSEETIRTCCFLLPQKDQEHEAFVFNKFYENTCDFFDGKKNIAPQKARETRVSVIELPHLSGASVFCNLWDMCTYRHDFFIDQISYRQQENERYFVGQYIINDEPIIPFAKGGLLRLYYQGNVNKTITGWGSILSVNLLHQVQIRSKTQHEVPEQSDVFEAQRFGFGSYRSLVMSDAMLTLPKIIETNQCALGPYLSWTYVPRFHQSHWYEMDRYDRLYPKNECAFLCDLQTTYSNQALGVSLKQGYDFFESKDWFERRKSLSDSAHVCPLLLEETYQINDTTCVAQQEFDWEDRSLLSASLDVACVFGKTALSLGYLYQDQRSLNKRALLSTVPHFIHLHDEIPLGLHVKLSYEGLFAAEHKKTFGLYPVLHRLRFDYQGHCWGFYVGVEEKQYREYGNPKTEYSLIFAVSLETLGSFAKKFHPSIEAREEPLESLAEE